ncbi:MAG TPA: phosphoribosylformylglycinamidine cyclo-ligase [Actinomycetales bacterium]|nr:phosphoribosylformylglycinamidine cyclo-ligase [Actinomycetales bacterium]
MTEPTSYAAAGVDVEAGDRAVELMKAAVTRTHGPQVLGGIGGFAGLYDASELLAYKRPLLASSTDGVGTKVAIAQAMDVHDTIGFDLVGMVVDDIVVCGAKPLVMTDYIATGKVFPERVAAIVRGIAEACEVAGTALVGGETAEHPGLLGDNEYDVAGAAVGVVEADDLLGPELVQTGDVVVALGSSGIHANGYSLVRKIIADAGWNLDRNVAEFGRTLGEELLEPTRVYASLCLEIARDAACEVRGFSHITGGGLGANLARVLPKGAVAVVDRATWQLPAVFSVLGELGGVPQGDLERTFNVGVGMIAITSPAGAQAAIAKSQAAGVPAWVMGEVVAAGSELDTQAAKNGGNTADYIQGAKGVDGGGVRLIGNYQA